MIKKKLVLLFLALCTPKHALCMQDFLESTLSSITNYLSRDSYEKQPIFQEHEYEDADQSSTCLQCKERISSTDGSSFFLVDDKTTFEKEVKKIIQESDTQTEAIGFQCDPIKQHQVKNEQLSNSGKIYQIHKKCTKKFLREKCKKLTMKICALSCCVFTGLIITTGAYFLLICNV